MADDLIRDTVESVSTRAARPNVLVILLDDMGFGAASAFGGPIDMPTADRLADGGLRYTRFHTTALCSPTRASLLTGRNPHAVGFGTVTNFVSDDPGYDCVRPGSAATLATILRDAGYATAAFGKWHQTPGRETGPTGPFDRWPTGEGFERFYGFLGGSTDQYYPALYDGITPIDPPSGPEDGYHLSEDLADRLIDWVGTHQAAASDRPFFAYLAMGATHSPLQVPAEWRDRYAGRFAHGWNRQREITLARQKELGIIPESGELTAWPTAVPTWDALDDEERRAAELLMELYAGFAEHTDAQVGRVIDALESMQLLDDTIVCYVLGDNGASAEGTLTGTAHEGVPFNGLTDSAARIVALADELGAPTTAPQYPFGWAQAMDTPYQWVKQVASHYGGTRNPLIVHWPAGIAARGQNRTQWHFVSDVMPTILDAAGIVAPDTVAGIPQQQIDGISMRYSFDDATAPDRRRTQYFEVFGNRGIYHDGWVACAVHRVPMQTAAADRPFDADVWELYDTDADWTQSRDLAAEQPARLTELRDLFHTVAADNQVLLDNTRMQRMRAETADEGSTVVEYPGTMPPLLPDAAIDVRNRTHRITARIAIDIAGATGAVVAQGARPDGGWALYLHEGRLHYHHCAAGMHHGTVGSAEVLAPGEYMVGAEIDYDGGGFGLGAQVRLTVDSRTVGQGRVDRTTAFYLGGTGLLTIGRTHGLPVTTDLPVGGSLPGTVHTVRIEAGGAAVRSAADRAATALAVQ